MNTIKVYFLGTDFAATLLRRDRMYRYSKVTGNKKKHLIDKLNSRSKTTYFQTCLFILTCILLYGLCLSYFLLTWGQ